MGRARVPRESVLEWLMEPEQPAMRYLVARDLLRPRRSERSLGRLRAEVPTRGWAAAILAKQREKTWWATKRTGYGPKYRSTIWQLEVLADLGMSRRDPRIANAVEFFFGLHYDPKRGGYSPGLRSSSWFGSHLCTTGNMVRTLIRLGYLGDPRAESAIRWLVDAQYADGGWDCFGRRVGTLDAWEAMSAFAEIPRNRRSADVRHAIEAGAEFFLERRLLHEGPHFERWWWLRYPWHYFYDVLVGLDLMTALGYGEDPRMREALDHLHGKRLQDGRWKLDHTNGDLVIERRGEPSKMITFLALRVLDRVGEIR